MIPSENNGESDDAKEKVVGGLLVNGHLIRLNTIIISITITNTNVEYK